MGAAAGPTVSVVMNCYNAAPFLAQAIDSVYAQTFGDWEIVLWDNLSSDSSPAIAQRYDRRLRYFRGSEFVPLGTARNLAVEHCRGRLIAFLDCDDLWLPEKLKRQVAALNSQPELGLVYSDCHIVDHSGAVRGKWSQRSRPHSGHVFDHLIQQNFIPILTLLVRSEVLGRAGPFQSYKYAEDWDILLKCASRCLTGYVSDPLASYRLHSAQSSSNYEIAIEESLAILRFWEQAGVSSRFLAAPRAMAFFNAGKGAIYRGDTAKARRYFRGSLRHRLLARTILFWALSFLGSGKVGKVRSTAVRMLGTFSYSDTRSRIDGRARRDG